MSNEKSSSQVQSDIETMAGKIMSIFADLLEWHYVAVLSLNKLTTSQRQEILKEYQKSTSKDNKKLIINREYIQERIQSTPIDIKEFQQHAEHGIAKDSSCPACRSSK